MPHSEDPFFHVGLHRLSQCTGLEGEILCPFLSPGRAELSPGSHGFRWEMRLLGASPEPSARSGQRQRNNSPRESHTGSPGKFSIQCHGALARDKILFLSVPAAAWGPANDRPGFPFVKDVPLSPLLLDPQVFERNVRLTNPLKAFQPSSQSPDNLTFSYRYTLW